MLSIFKETTVHTFALAFSAPFVHLILLHNLFFLPLESHEQMTILQVIPKAYIKAFLDLIEIRAMQQTKVCY